MTMLITTHGEGRSLSLVLRPEGGPIVKITLREERTAQVSEVAACGLKRAIEEAATQLQILSGVEPPSMMKLADPAAPTPEFVREPRQPYPNFLRWGAVGIEPFVHVLTHCGSTLTLVLDDAETNEEAEKAARGFKTVLATWLKEATVSLTPRSAGSADDSDGGLGGAQPPRSDPRQGGCSAIGPFELIALRGLLRKSENGTATEHRALAWDLLQEVARCPWLKPFIAEIPHAMRAFGLTEGQE